MRSKIRTKNTTPKPVRATFDQLKTIEPELKPKDYQFNKFGTEPEFVNQPPDEGRGLALVESFNWYSRHFDRKIAKEQLIKYAVRIGRTDLLKNLKRVDDKEIIESLGWLARLHLRGLVLTEVEQNRLSAEMERLVSIEETSIAATTEKVSNRPNVQEIMRERLDEAGGEIEGWFDEFVTSGAKGQITNTPISVLRERNIIPQHVGILVDAWEKRLNEYETVQAGKDKQLVEGYSHLGKLQVRNIIKFCETVITELNSYVNIKKAETVRKRKPVSPEKQASKVKCLRTFEPLKLTSVSPAKIVGANEVWLYDTSKRKLHYFIADDHVGSLTVKGTTIVGFDTVTSGVKTIRKPEEFIPKIATAGKPASRKMFKELKTVQTQPNGRINEHMIILKVN